MITCELEHLGDWSKLIHSSHMAWPIKYLGGENADTPFDDVNGDLCPPR